MCPRGHTSESVGKCSLKYLLENYYIITTTTTKIILIDITQCMLVHQHRHQCSLTRIMLTMGTKKEGDRTSIETKHW